MAWHISIYRQTDDGTSPATAESPKGTRLAVWEAGLFGLNWVGELVKAGKAICLGGIGFPCRYTATAENLIPRIVDERPETFIDRAAAAACRSDEWLLIEAWDES